jgi:hypothetical protein
MRTHVVWWIVPLFLGVVACGKKGAPGTDSVAALLQKSHPKVAWELSKREVVDVTCDGVPDVVVVGYEKKGAVWLAVVPGSTKEKSKPRLFALRFHGGRRSDDYCAAPVRIETHPINCYSDGANLSSCTDAKGCRGISIAGDKCAPLSVYWDDMSGQLSSWRN